MGGWGFFPLNHEEGHLACWGVLWWNRLQRVAAHYTSFQWTTVYGSALCRNRKWKVVTKQPFVSPLISGLLFIQTQTSKQQECIHKRTVFMVYDSYVSMVSEILPCHHDLWCLWWVDYNVLFISKCCYQIYGVLKYIANISGLTAFARHSLGSCFFEGCDL